MNVIIGGTHGLGREIALALQTNGEETYVVGRSYDETHDGAGEALDLLDEEAVRTFANKVGKMSLRGFWWVAGVDYNGDFAEQDDPQQLVDVNFRNVIPIAHAAWKKELKQQTTSKFVVISSTTGVRARKNEAIYAATKHAQVGFGRSLGMESERLKSKVQVTLILPGGMKTPFWDGHRPEGFENYLDPAKVAERIVTAVRHQSGHFAEDLIERGSL